MKLYSFVTEEVNIDIQKEKLIKNIHTDGKRKFRQFRNYLMDFMSFNLLQVIF